MCVCITPWVLLLLPLTRLRHFPTVIERCKLRREKGRACRMGADYRIKKGALLCSARLGSARPGSALRTGTTQGLLFLSTRSIAVHTHTGTNERTNERTELANTPESCHIADCCATTTTADNRRRVSSNRNGTMQRGEEKEKEEALACCCCCCNLTPSPYTQYLTCVLKHIVLFFFFFFPLLSSAPLFAAVGRRRRRRRRRH